MGNLAHFLGNEPSNITGIVDRLEAKRLVERRSDGKDRRLKALVVTAAGSARSYGHGGPDPQSNRRSR